MLFPKTHRAQSFLDLIVLIYGIPKGGKTTLLHNMGEYYDKPVLFIATEDGHAALETSVVRVSGKTGVEKLLYKIESNKDQLAKEHSAIVIDLVSELDAMVAEWVCETHGVSALSDIDHGKGWNLHLTAFKTLINRFLALGLPIKFIAHTKERPFKTKGNEAITIQSPDMFTKNSRNFILGKCDAIGYLYSEGIGQTKLSFVPSLANDAGSRLPELVGEYTVDPKKPLEVFKLLESKLGGKKEKKKA